MFCSPKSSTVVLASFCSAPANVFFSNFGLPPNKMTCVHPGPKFKAVAVCLNRGSCAPSGRMSWGEIKITYCSKPSQLFLDPWQRRGCMTSYKQQDRLEVSQVISTRPVYIMPFLLPIMLVPYAQGHSQLYFHKVPIMLNMSPFITF